MIELQHSRTKKNMKNILSIYQWNSNIGNGSLDIRIGVIPNKTYVPESLIER